MRSTKKYIAELLRSIKYDLNLKSDSEASRYFYDVINSGALSRIGYKLSYYKGNNILATKDNIKYIHVPYEYLWLQNTFISENTLIEG